jgi:hypothetical protein
MAHVIFKTIAEIAAANIFSKVGMYKTVLLIKEAERPHLVLTVYFLLASDYN